MRRNRKFGLVGALLVVPVLLGLAGCTRYGASLSRPSDPVVLTGWPCPSSSGGDPQHVVGFSWDGKVWHQIPVQVDERDLVNPGQIYHLPAELPDAVGHDHAVQDARLHAARVAHRGLLVDRPPTRRSTRTRRSMPTTSSLPRQRRRQAGRRVGRRPRGRRHHHPRGGQGHRPAGHLELRLRLPVPQQHAHRRLGRHHRRAVHLQPRLGQLHRRRTRWAPVRSPRTTPGASTRSTPR